MDSALWMWGHWKTQSLAAKFRAQKAAAFSKGHFALAVIFLERLEVLPFEECYTRFDMFSTMQRNQWKKRGLTMSGIKHGLFWDGTGFPAQVSIFARDGAVVVSQCGVEMGQGLYTKVRLVLHLLLAGTDKVLPFISCCKHGYNTAFYLSSLAASIVITLPFTLLLHASTVVTQPLTHALAAPEHAGTVVTLPLTHTLATPERAGRVVTLPLKLATSRHKYTATFHSFAACKHSSNTTCNSHYATAQLSQHKLSQYMLVHFYNCTCKCLVVPFNTCQHSCSAFVVFHAVNCPGGLKLVWIFQILRFKKKSGMRIFCYCLKSSFFPSLFFCFFCWDFENY